MGYYIQVPKNRNKAEQIVTLFDGKIVDPPTAFEDIPTGKALVCVVDNGLFEGAAFCYSPAEFREFHSPSDTRPKRWVLIDWAKACELTGYK